MMNLRLLNDTMKLMKRGIDSTRNANYTLITPYIKYFSMPDKSTYNRYEKYNKGVMSYMQHAEKLNAVTTGSSEVRSIQDLIKSRDTHYRENSFNANSASVEYQKKFTLSAACIALFLIGAPLGAIIRKGGLGLPVVVSVVFFLIYYIISTIGEKAVKSGDASAFVGMWVAIIILTPFGIFLSYKAANDSVIFDADSYKRVFTNLFIKVKKLVVKG